MMVKKECCSKCGFPKDIQRKPVILDCNILSVAEYMEDECEECGHMKNGSSIPVVNDMISKIVDELRQERKRLIEFIHHFQFLIEGQKKEVCVEVPRFVKPKYKSKGNQEEDDMKEPYSWNVVYFEVINDTKLARVLLDNIDWEKIEDEQ